MDAKKEWFVLCGVTRDANGMVGKALLYSELNKSSRVLDGHACTFISTTTPEIAQKCTIMCMA